MLIVALPAVALGPLLAHTVRELADAGCPGSDEQGIPD